MSSSTEPIARLGRPHGLEGFLGLYVDDDDLKLFSVGASVQIAGRDLVVRDVRPGKHGPQVAFEGVIDRSSAEEIRNLEVFIDAVRDLKDGDYWVSDLVGLEVRPGGGVIIGVQSGPGQDRLVVDRDNVIFEVPFVTEMVPVVDVAAGYVVIDEIEGLIPPSP